MQPMDFNLKTQIAEHMTMFWISSVRCHVHLFHLSSE